MPTQKLWKGFTFADVDVDKCVDHSLGAEVWSLSFIFAQTLSTRFGQNFEVFRQDFEAEVATDPWLRL